MCNYLYVLNKIEILRIGDEHDERDYTIVDTEGQDILIKSIESIKVCGITYSYNEELAYQLNITEDFGVRGYFSVWLSTYYQ